DLSGRLGRGADRKPVVIADDLGELVLVLAEIGLKVDFHAAVLEDLHGGRRQRIRNENFGFGHLNQSVLDDWFEIVTRGLDPRVHLVGWMAGSNPAMTTMNEAATPPSAAWPWSRRRPSRFIA